MITSIAITNIHDHGDCTLKLLCTLKNINNKVFKFNYICSLTSKIYTTQAILLKELTIKNILITKFNKSYK